MSWLLIQECTIFWFHRPCFPYHETRRNHVGQSTSLALPGSLLRTNCTIWILRILHAFGPLRFHAGGLLLKQHCAIVFGSYGLVSFTLVVLRVVSPMETPRISFVTRDPWESCRPVHFACPPRRATTDKLHQLPSSLGFHVFLSQAGFMFSPL